MNFDTEHINLLEVTQAFQHMMRSREVPPMGSLVEEVVAVLEGGGWGFEVEVEMEIQKVHHLGLPRI